MMMIIKILLSNTIVNYLNRPSNIIFVNSIDIVY